jgi:hypothetical protein
MTTPTTPTTPTDGQVPNQKLVQELLAMRDALVALSLCLKDWKFELDQPGRQAAQEQVTAALLAMRLAAKQNTGMTHIKKLGDCLPD